MMRVRVRIERKKNEISNRGRAFEGHDEKRKTRIGGVDGVRLCHRSIVGGGVRRAPPSHGPAARAHCNGHGGRGRWRTTTTTTTIVTEAAAAACSVVVVVGGGEGAVWSARPPCSCFDDAEFRARRPHPTPPSDVIWRGCYVALARASRIAGPSSRTT